MMDELIQIARDLPDEQMQSLLVEARLRSQKPKKSAPWPPPWLASATAKETDLGRHVDKYLAAGFGQ